ncbi:MAG: hypothetical protein JO168_19800 [Solirubrobacterales bacterium]|nr:hypothetical protein [Solirubrobacterales bacterium]MBV9714788.1 hypothetical protein [Solirubrobacterales bacterium]
MPATSARLALQGVEQPPAVVDGLAGARLQAARLPTRRRATARHGR